MSDDLKRLLAVDTTRLLPEPEFDLSAALERIDEAFERLKREDNSEAA